MGHLNETNHKLVQIRADHSCTLSWSKLCQYCSYAHIPLNSGMRNVHEVAFLPTVCFKSLQNIYFGEGLQL